MPTLKELQDAITGPLTGAMLIEVKDGIALMKREFPTWEDKPYLVTHIQWEYETSCELAVDSKLKVACFWSTYDLTLEQAAHLFKEKTEGEKRPINTPEELKYLSSEMQAKLNNDANDYQTAMEGHIEGARDVVECSTHEYSILIPEETEVCWVDGGYWIGAAAFIPVNGPVPEELK